MSPRLITGSVLVAVLVAVVLIARGGDDPYKVRVQLDNANGLREGSRVEIGGLAVGRVETLATDAQDRVVATLHLEDGKAIGAGASAAIQAKNMLGEKSLQLRVGRLSEPQPSGSVIPAARVEQSVDLDAVLDVLEPTTRARLGILINEAGGAVAGRKAELRDILRQLPPSFAAATDVVDRLVSDNRTLGDLIDRSDRFVARFAAERRQLTRFVDVVGQTATTVATRRAELARTLGETPRTLASLRGLLGELERTTKPLGRAAREISTTTAPLTATLKAVRPFQRAAAPVLDDAIDVAPALSRLGLQATPVVRRASPTVNALATFSSAATPVTRTADAWVDDLLAVLQGWSRAIQGRDGVSHMFRAKVHVNADNLRHLLPVSEEKSKEGRRRTAPGSQPPPEMPAAPPAPRAPKLPGLPKLPDLPELIPGLPDVNETLEDATSGVTGLLDYLMGK